MQLVNGSLLGTLLDDLDNDDLCDDEMENTFDKRFLAKLGELSEATASGLSVGREKPYKITIKLAFKLYLDG